MKHNIFICSPILIEIEIYHSGHRGTLSPPLSRNSNSSFIGQFWWNLKHNIFKCPPMIIEIEIYDKVSPSPPSKNTKLHQNRPINKEIYVFEGRMGGTPYHKFLSQLLLVNIWKRWFKFHQNRIINEELDFWGVKEGWDPDFKNLEKPHTEWWFHCTPKVSALVFVYAMKIWELFNLLINSNCFWIQQERLPHSTFS